MSIAYAEVPVSVVIQACNDYLVELEQHTEYMKKRILDYEVEQAMKPKFFGLGKPKSREAVEQQVLKDLQSGISRDYSFIVKRYNYRLNEVNTIVQMCNVSDVDTVRLSDDDYSLIKFEIYNLIFGTNVLL